jgi:CDP-glucose 4,6-dehydratase
MIRPNPHDGHGQGTTLLAVIVTPSFWAGRRVLVTGHTGFKGGWLSMWLAELGATVTGVGLAPTDRAGFFDAVGLGTMVDSHLVDILDRDRLEAVVHAADPEIVFHLAAQALVLPSIEHPVDTFATNVVGTANVLEVCHRAASPRVVLVVTSDKVYENDASGRPFIEGDRLGGGDPYSASKAAAELVVASWRHTFGRDGGPVLATARAGNVIGGGDLAAGRLVPDLLRAFAADRPAELRNPHARRPWQFVLDPVAGYLAYAERLAAEDASELPTALNFGPAAGEAFTVGEIADRAILAWGRGSWLDVSDGASVEAPVLTLDASLADRAIGWRPALDVEEAVGWTIDWLRGEADAVNMHDLCRAQIAAYRRKAGW